MGRKKKYNTEEEKLEAQRRWNMEYYHRNKEDIKEKNVKNYYKKKEYKVDEPKPGSKKIDMVGQVVGKLIVESYHGLNEVKNKVWLCKCECGNTTYATTIYLRNGKKTSCGCNQHKSGSDVYNYSGYKDITGARWYSIKSNATTRGLPFEITKEFVWDLYLKQNELCSFSNIPISFKDSTASIDRIDNDRGYFEDNISIVHKDINLMRNKFSVDYFKSLCEQVFKNGFINE